METPGSSPRAYLCVQDELRDFVLEDLIASYVNFTNQMEQQFVLRKVSSTLAAFALHPNSSWHFPLRHVLASLCDARIEQHEDINDFHKTWTSIQHIHPPQLRSALWLGSSLAEEVTKSDVKGVERSVSRIVALILLIPKASNWLKRR
jgi:hypothetical protein